jgi:hypothetical protein
MALEEFENEELSDREKNLVRMKSITNYVMGVFFIGVGFAFLFPPATMIKKLEGYDPTMITLFAFICFIYGAFRIYRGYAKNYFRS